MEKKPEKKPVKKGKYAHVKPGSLGFALFRDRIGGGADPVDSPPEEKDGEKP